MPTIDDADFATYDAKYARHRALAAEILPRNKSVLIDALAGVGINTVVVRFDGYGDSGQIEEITAFDANTNPIDLPAVDIVVEIALFEHDKCNAETTSLRAYVETLTYELLRPRIAAGATTTVLTGI